MLWLADSGPAAERSITLDEQTRHLILQEIQDLQVKVEKTNPQRGLKRLQQRADVCVDDKLYTDERQAFSLASRLPQVVLPDLRLYVSRDALLSKQIDALVQGTSLELANLFTALPKFRLGLMEGRAYGDKLDAVLGLQEFQRQIWRRPGADMGEGLVQMLLNQRVEGIIEYPVVVQRFSQPQENGIQLQSYPLTGTSHFTQGYVLCARSAQGQQAVDAISAAIGRAARKRLYLEAHLYWFDPSVHQELVEYYNQVYGTDFSVTRDEG
ncbi:hypothetical protein GCM10027098_01800 [Bowmanella dokdonensis]